MPCLNEEKHIGNAIESLLDNFFLNNCELIVIDGMSHDGTQRIVQSFQEKGLKITFLENKKKLQVYGLNIGLKESNGEIIIRADAHCLYPPCYIENCVKLLHTTGASNVGGVMFPRGNHIVQKAIALAMQHPIGVGNSKFHLGNYSGYVDTVYLGTFRKKIFSEIGLYDTQSHPNEDAELNLRILQTGKKIYLDSSIKVTYFPRETLEDLGIQYFKYGKGRCYTVLKHKKITSLRQVFPVVLVILLITSILFSPFSPHLLLIPIAYVFSLQAISIITWPQKRIPFRERLFMGAAWGVMHICWGVGFLSHFILNIGRRIRD